MTTKEPHSGPPSDAPDSKIAAAQKEIAEVMKRHDLGGAVILHTAAFAHYFFVLDPSWSCARYVSDQNAIRVKCLRKDYPSVEAQQKALADTTGFIMGTADICEIVKDNMMQVAAMIASKIDFAHRTQNLSKDRFDLE